MKHRIITNELMRRNFFITAAEKDRIKQMGMQAMEDYKKTLQAFNTAGYLYLYRNPKLLDKTTVQYYVINLN